MKRKIRTRRPESELLAWLAQCPRGATLAMLEAEGFDLKDLEKAESKGFVTSSSRRWWNAERLVTE